MLDRLLPARVCPLARWLPPALLLGVAPLLPGAAARRETRTALSVAIDDGPVPGEGAAAAKPYHFWGERRAGRLALDGHRGASVKRIEERLQSAFQLLLAARSGEEAAVADMAAKQMSEAEKALEMLHMSSDDSLELPNASSLVQSGIAGQLASESSRRVWAESVPSSTASRGAGQESVSAASSDQAAQNQSSGWFAPSARDLEQVALWASEMAGGGRQGAAAAAAVRNQPGDAAQTLRALAARARLAADGADRDGQAFWHLLELQLEERRTHSQLQLTHNLIRQLAADFESLQELRRMTADQLSAMQEPDNLARYFRGLSRSSPVATLQMSNDTRAAAAGARPMLARVLVLSCSFGDGHKSAAEAVASYLQTNVSFHVDVVDTTTDPRFQGSSVGMGLSPSLTSYIYNSLVLKRQWYRLHNLWDSLKLLTSGQLVKPCAAPGCNNERKDKFRGLILDLRPDAIVTVYHMDLMPILEVAKDLGNLPVLHVATDLDTKMREVFGEEGPAPVYPRFLVGVPFASQAAYNSTSPVPENRTALLGYPVRSAFLQASAGIFSQRRERGRLAPPGSKLVLVMTGGGGQDVPWPQFLASHGIGAPLHVIVVAGRNSAAARELALLLPGSVRLPDGRTVLQGLDTSVTVEVARDPTTAGRNGSDAFYVSAPYLRKLMDAADAIITKPGGGTTAEAAYCGLPALFDASNGLLHWEESTVQAFEQLGLGARFAGAGQLPQALRKAVFQRRSRRLVEDPGQPGAVLQTAERVRAAIHRLVAAPCKQCELFQEAS